MHARLYIYLHIFIRGDKVVSITNVTERRKYNETII